VAHISVVVPFLNVERYIARCVEALLAQTYPPAEFEILLIDNNSSDASAAIARAIIARQPSANPRITLLSERKQGSYAARNRGLREASGEIIAFTDPDCVPFPNWLDVIGEAMTSPEVGIVLGSHEFATDSPMLAMLAAYENEKKAYVYGGEATALYFGHTNNMAVRRRLFETEGHFLETSRGADTLFVRQCVERHSCRLAEYAPRMQVRHLEIDSVATYLRKMATYGRSSRSFAPGAWARPLSNGQRLSIWRSTARRNEYSSAEALVLGGLLGVGLACWSWGRMTAGRRERGRRSNLLPTSSRH
jgi:glycosyltransferase involved in cell wall biosynthesis